MNLNAKKFRLYQKKEENIMNTEDITVKEYKQAHEEISSEDMKRGFTIHFVVYVLVNVMLIFINLMHYFYPQSVSYMQMPRIIWFPYPLLGWGIGITIHYLFTSYWSDFWHGITQLRIEKRIIRNRQNRNGSAVNKSE